MACLVLHSQLMFALGYDGRSLDCRTMAVNASSSELLGNSYNIATIVRFSKTYPPIHSRNRANAIRGAICMRVIMCIHHNHCDSVEQNVSELPVLSLRRGCRPMRMCLYRDDDFSSQGMRLQRK